MKILILANSDLGLFKFRKELIEKLIDCNHEIFISLPKGELVYPLEKLGCVFIDTYIDRRGVNPKTDFNLIKKYIKIIKNVNPDLVLTYTIKPNIYGGIASRLTRKEYAVNITGLGTAFEKPGILKLFVIKLYQIALKKVKIVFVENSYIAKKVISFGLCTQDKVVVLNGAGVNTECYSYQDYPSNEEIRFLFVGRIMKEKGIEELLSAMNRLFIKKHNCVLCVVGPLEEDYESILKRYSSEGWLEYLGFQEDIQPFIKAADCFVLPSYHEGMANTNLECASCGRPVITSDIPGCREAVIPEITGFLCEPRNVESLYKQLLKFTSLSHEERKIMGIKGRVLMEREFDRRKIVDKTIGYLI